MIFEVNHSNFIIYGIQCVSFIKEKDFEEEITECH